MLNRVELREKGGGGDEMALVQRREMIFIDDMCARPIHLRHAFFFSFFFLDGDHMIYTIPYTSRADIQKLSHRFSLTLSLSFSLIHLHARAEHITRSYSTTTTTSHTHHSKRERAREGLLQNPAREKGELFKIQQERKVSYSKSSKRER